MRWFSILSVLACLHALAGNVYSGEMDGEWVSIARSRAGVQQLGAPTHAVIKDGKFNTMRNGKVEELGSITEELGVVPRQYTVEMTGDVEDAGKSFHGIFSQSADMMFTCANPEPGGDYPTEFASTKENETILIVWQRKSVPSAATELDRVCEFIQVNAANRTLVMEKEGKLAGGGVGYTFRREATLCNLVRSDNRLTYNVIYSIKQEKWDIGEDNGKTDPRTEDRMLVVRYELGFKKSTGEVVGHSETLTTTRKDWGGSTDTIRMRLDNDRLVVERRTGLYDDYFDRGDGFYPGSSDEEQLWRLENGKLVIESRSKVFRVNPKTLDKEVVDDRGEPTIEVEAARLPF